jgi:hypothetical protein
MRGGTSSLVLRLRRWSRSNRGQGLPTALSWSVDDQFERIVAHVKNLVNGLAAQNLTGAVWLKLFVGQYVFH